MIDILSAIILGLVEGLTEFVPVSSTGHLILVAHLLGVAGEKAETFEIFIQLGAILAVVFLYKERFLSLLCWRNPGGKVVAGFDGVAGIRKLFLACIPAFIVGGLFHTQIKASLFSPSPVAIALILGGIIMVWIETRKSSPKTFALEAITLTDALFIGICQCAALWPGISRAGATIVGAMLLGVERKAAAEFSFLIAVPTMFAAVGYDLLKSRAYLSLADLPTFAIGFAVSFITAVWAIKFFLSILQTHTLRSFGYYRIILGCIVYLLLR